MKARHIRLQWVEQTNFFKITFGRVKLFRPIAEAEGYAYLDVEVRCKFEGEKSSELHKFGLMPFFDVEYDGLNTAVSIEGIVEWLNPLFTYNQCMIDFFADWEEGSYKDWMEKGFDTFEKRALFRARYVRGGFIGKMPTSTEVRVDFSLCKDYEDLWLTLSDAFAGIDKAFGGSFSGLDDNLSEVSNKDIGAKKPKMIFKKPRNCDEILVMHSQSIINIYRDHGYQVVVE